MIKNSFFREFFLKDFPKQWRKNYIVYSILGERILQKEFLSSEKTYQIRGPWPLIM